MIALDLHYKVSEIMTTSNCAYAWLVESTTPPGSPPRNIRTLPSTTQKSVTAEVTSIPAKRRYVPDTHDIDIVKKIQLTEIELRDRNTVLRGSKPNVCLLSVLSLSSLMYV